MPKQKKKYKSRRFEESVDTRFGEIHEKTKKEFGSSVSGTQTILMNAYEEKEKKNASKLA